MMPVLPGEGPRTRELYAAIRRLIEGGQAPSGTKLPTTRDLAARLGVSRAAAVAAFELLVADGFAEARVGAGTFVAPQVPALAPVSREVPPMAAPSPPLPCELGVATMDEKTMRIFRRLLSRSLARPGPEHFHYGDARGTRALRDAIAAYLRTARGVRCDPEQIIVTTGTMHGMDLVVRSVIRPGDAAWIEDPCYGKARTILKAAGARLVGVPVDGEGIDPAQGTIACSKARLAYVTPSHQFPLGVAMSMRRRLALLEWARRNDGWIIEDDYDSEFRFSGPPLACLQGMDDGDRVAYLGTFSKVLFPGMRIGYAVVPRALLAAVLRLRIQSDRQPPTLAQGAIADFLDQGHFAAHLRRVRRRVQSARDRLVAGLRRGGLEVDVPEQGLHLVAGLPSSFDDRALAIAAREADVGALPLSPLHVDAPQRQGLILGFSGFDGEVLAEAAERLCRLL
ncbi:GntR family transcriptional regulator [Labrys miyagiensis]